MLYRNKRSNDSALYYYEKSLSINENYENKIITMSNIAGVYIRMEEYKLALKQLTRTKRLADSLNLSEPTLF